MAKAEEEQRVLISADTDFGNLLARTGAKLPSVLLIRRLAGRRAAEQATIILANLPAVSHDLADGAVVVLTDEWVRIRKLPMTGRAGPAQRAAPLMPLCQDDGVDGDEGVDDQGI
jgi:hypothetical protein